MSRRETMFWRAPYPPPAISREYEELDPGWTRALREETLKESAHRRHMEIAESQRQTNGLWITAFLATLVFLIGGGLIYTGHEWGAWVMITALVSLVGASVYRVNASSKEAPPALPRTPDVDQLGGGDDPNAINGS